MFLKLKNYEVKIKGQRCVDGSKQRNWLSKEDITYPTMSTEGLILLLIIDAIEGRDITTANTPGAFLQTDYEKGDIHIKMKWAMVTLLEEIYPAFYKYLIYLDSCSRKCMDSEANKAIYGTLDTSLLLWIFFQKSRRNGLRENKNKCCTMKKIVKGKQCTILWHVDDLNMLHDDSEIVSSVLSDIDAEYGDIEK